LAFRCASLKRPTRQTQAAVELTHFGARFAAERAGQDASQSTTMAIERRSWWALAVLSLASFLLLLDDTAVSVALPAIQRHFSLSLGGLEWMVNSYTLTLAILLLPAGRLADLLGRRRMFLLGLVVFTAASLMAGLVHVALLLVVARALQGLGAAFIMPAALAIIVATFPPARRAAAIGIWAGLSGVALGLGPLLGAALTESLGWSSIFLINVPLGLLCLALGRRWLSESRGHDAGPKLDIAGLLVFGAALYAILAGLDGANRRGWAAPVTVLMLAAGTAGLFLFWQIERRQAHPMLDTTLFRNRRLSGANVVGLLTLAAMCSVFFFISLYLQLVLGYAPLAAGAVFLPMTLPIIVVAPLSARLAARLGPRAVIATGMAMFATALVALAWLVHVESLWALLLALGLGGVGIGLTTTPVSIAALESVPTEKAGMGSGVLNTFRMIGLSLGIAVMGAIVSGTGLGTSRVSMAFVDGLSVALLVNAAFALASVVVAFLTIGPPVNAVAQEIRVDTPASVRSAQD
jgi:EmrB/QacA subfamily drug resistance transporter